jgi:hypothetical protein
MLVPRRAHCSDASSHTFVREAVHAECRDAAPRMTNLVMPQFPHSAAADSRRIPGARYTVHVAACARPAHASAAGTTPTQLPHTESAANVIAWPRIFEGGSRPRAFDRQMGST